MKVFHVEHNAQLLLTTDWNSKSPPEKDKYTVERNVMNAEKKNQEIDVI